MSSNVANFIVNPTPTITALAPTNVPAGHPSFTLTITGSSDYVAGDTVAFGGRFFIDAVEHSSRHKYRDGAGSRPSPRPASVAVHVVSADGVASNAAIFTVNPTPTITTIAPDDFTAGHAGFLITGYRGPTTRRETRCRSAGRYSHPGISSMLHDDNRERPGIEA